VKKQPTLIKPFVAALQKVLRTTDIGRVGTFTLLFCNLNTNAIDDSQYYNVIDDSQYVPCNQSDTPPGATTLYIGQKFFGNVAQAKTVKNILKEAYGNPDAVTDELVDVILTPGLQPGAAVVRVAATPGCQTILALSSIEPRFDCKINNASEKLYPTNPTRRRCSWTSSRTAEGPCPRSCCP
jgi:hypothetical protein